MKRTTKALKNEVRLVSAYLQEHEVIMQRQGHTYRIEAVEATRGGYIHLRLRPIYGGPHRDEVIAPEMDAWRDILTPAQAPQETHP